MTLSVVIPGDDLNDVDLRAFCDKLLPAPYEQPVVAAVDPVLVPTIGAIMLVI